MSKPQIKQTSRYLALEILEKVEKQKAYTNLLLDHVLNQHDLSAADTALLTNLVYGVLQRKITLDMSIDTFVKQPEKMQAWVRILLEVSAYQLWYLDKIPNHALINEAVNIAKFRGHQGTANFVNGVLRAMTRNPQPDFTTINADNERISAMYSMPLWLTDKLINQIGLSETEKLGHSSLLPSRVSARVQTKLLSVTDALSELEKADYDVSTSEVSPFGIISKKNSLVKSELFKKGNLTMQDESSMLVAPAMQIEPGHQVLDACAAPGGKTTHIAQFLDAQQGGKVTALDLHANKVRLIEENATRLQLNDVVFAEQMDARDVVENFPDESFDRILVDAPCSGFGLIRRKPEMKYYKESKDFLNLPKIQLEILTSMVAKVKVSGIITYSTCTIFPEENQQVIVAFLEAHPNFTVIPVMVEQQVAEYVYPDGLQLYPHQLGTDGFYICCLRRIY